MTAADTLTLYDRLGAHPGAAGTRFAVRAPGADRVSVVGDFNRWDPAAHPLVPVDDRFSATVAEARPGARYRFHVVRDGSAETVADPWATRLTADGDPVVWPLEYRWSDERWLRARPERRWVDGVMTVYGVDPVAWGRRPGEEGRPPLDDLGQRLGTYASRLGFSHVALRPVMLHPPKHGGPEAPTLAPDARWGTPQELMALIDELHRWEVGVILDWAPPALVDAGRDEIAASAALWIDRYHVDGLRLEHELAATDPQAALWSDALLQLATSRPGTLVIAPWPERPPSGAGLVPDDAWSDRLLSYLAHDPIHRKHHHLQLTDALPSDGTRLAPLDHRRTGLPSRMSGDTSQRLATVRLLLAISWCRPGVPLLFMGSELGQWSRWQAGEAIDWRLLDIEPHRGLHRLVGDLNRTLREVPALRDPVNAPAAFEWVDAADVEQSVVAFLRRGADPSRPALVVLNCTPVPRANYRLGVPHGGRWRELLNSDARDYGGSGRGNLGGVEASPIGAHGRPFSVSLTLPPLSLVLLGPE